MTSLWRKLPNIIILVRVLYLNFGPSLFIKRDTCLRWAVIWSFRNVLLKHNGNGVTNIIKTLQISFIERRFFDQKCNAFFQCFSAHYTILFCIFCHFNIQLSRKNWQFIGYNGDDVFARNVWPLWDNILCWVQSSVR